jgi:hypothetical protein
MADDLHPPCVIGIDFGTESVRAGVFDALTGEALSFCSEPYETTHPRPSWAEQDPKAWWSALGNAVRGAVATLASSSSAAATAAASASAPLPPPSFDPNRDVKALCVDTTCCTVVAFDRADPERNPLRPAILWMDMRASSQAAQVLATGDAAVRVNGGGKGPVSAEWFLPKALWIKQNEPEVWNHKNAGVCEFQDWINLRLTDEYVASRNNVGVRWHFGDGKAPLSLLEKLGLSDLRDRWPAEEDEKGGFSKVLALGARIGQGLTREAAEHLGLAEGLIVAQGGADAFIGMIGLDVTRPGQMAMLTVSFVVCVLFYARRELPGGAVARRGAARSRAISSLFWGGATGKEHTRTHRCVCIFEPLAIPCQARAPPHPLRRFSRRHAEARRKKKNRFRSPRRRQHNVSRAQPGHVGRSIRSSSSSSHRRTTSVRVDDCSCRSRSSTTRRGRGRIPARLGDRSCRRRRPPRRRLSRLSRLRPLAASADGAPAARRAAAPAAVLGRLARRPRQRRRRGRRRRRPTRLARRRRLPRRGRL